jgi:hypothetical protein
VRTRFGAVLCFVLAFATTNFLFAAPEGPSGEASAQPASASADANPAPGPSLTAPINDPLLRLLVNKGILTDSEASSLHGNSAGNQQLLQLLRQKGILSDADLSSLQPSSAPTPGSAEAPALLATAAQASQASGAPPKSETPKPPAVIAAVAPIRVLPIDPPKREGLIPDLKIGPVRVKPYGFFKASAVYDTSSPRGDDFPLPQFVFGDSGPNPSPEFHIKARASRFGSNFEWLDPSPKLAVTGRVEVDFEGNFSQVDNRNISSVRSSQPSIRLAWGRVDYAITDKTTLFSLFGQDWTPFGSSTLPNSLETTGLGLGFGTLYERDPQVRGGFVHSFGGSRSAKVLAELAAVYPAFGNVPSATNIQFIGPNAGNATAAVTGCATPPCGTVALPTVTNTGTGLSNQLNFGERQGADSGRPGVQSRIALQWQLDHAPGVAPAQLIVSGEQQERVAIVLNSSIPTAAFRAAFPRGVQVSSDSYGVSYEAQLPTRFATFLAKYYHGGDLRFFFADQFFSTYNATAGATAGSIVTAASIDGSSGVAIGMLNGVPTVFPQKPIRDNGGFLELGLPLSRWAHADPIGRNAGWTMNLHYGLDASVARDVRLSAPGGARDKSDWSFANLQYKLNTWVTFGLEEGYYRTKALPNSTTGLFTGTLWQGVPSREAHDLRSEFATIFTF